MQQRIDEWTKNYNEDYYNRQFKNPYRSTIKFADWLEELEILGTNKNSSVLDIGAGKGANLYYLKERFPSSTYLGLDINNDFVNEGNSFFQEKMVQGCKLMFGDLYKLDFAEHKDKFEGIISLQTLSWLPEYRIALKEIMKLNASWIALSSLFYEGLIDCKIEVTEYNSTEEIVDARKCFYNIYSLPLVKKIFIENGYTKFKYIPFEIDIDLPKPLHSGMTTYTEQLISGKRLQRSGPLLMSWYFVFAQKE